MCANEAAVMDADRLQLWALIGGTGEEALMGINRHHWWALTGITDGH
ncbi:unnamed protein product [Staurois parvus]|uniref:Uncharacterized protein n=1 Tax=Staurois parvus TaxID=386267 RepID=A0ABN9H1M6_9NEOB|nr:unnamed protein product [Staurois parvus]